MLQRQHSFKWAQWVNPAKSPTKPDSDSPHPSPQQMEHDLSQSRTATTNPISSTSSTSQRGQTPSSTESSGPSGPHPPPSSSIVNPSRQESSDNLKSFKVSLEDPTWKVLPAALKKYKINNDNWQNYAMFICYGSPGQLHFSWSYLFIDPLPGSRIERCLSYDEKPLLLFQKLKDAKKNPVFMLKHIKDIRSPIAVAQQKQALRKASITSEQASNLSKPSSTIQGKVIGRPSKHEVHQLSSPAPSLTGTTAQPGWPEVTSPTIENKAGDELTINRDTVSSSMISHGHYSSDNTKLRNTAVIDSSDTDTTKREMPPPMAGVSYAVAIYPYMAEQEDEFDVVVYVYLVACRMALLLMWMKW